MIKKLGMQIPLGLAVSITLATAGCGGDETVFAPTSPAARQEASASVSYESGWDGWLDQVDASNPNAVLATCPNAVSGIGPVTYQGRQWFISRTHQSQGDFNRSTQQPRTTA